MSFSLLWYFVVGILSFVKSEDKVYPSVRYGMNNTQMKEIERAIVQKYLQGKVFDLEEVHFRQKIDFIGTIELNITNSSFRFVDITDNTLDVVLVEPNQIKAIITEAKAKIPFDYTFRSNFYSNGGNGTIDITNVTFEIDNNLLTIQSEVEPQKKAPAIGIEKFLISSADFDFVFSKEGALEKLLKYIALNLKNAVLEVVHKKFENDWKPQVNKEILNFMSHQNLSFPLGNTSMTVSYSMNEDPKIKDNGLQLSLELEIIDKEVKYPGKTYDIPEISNTKTAIEIFVSQYILDNYFYILYKKGQIAFELKGDSVPVMSLTVNIMKGIWKGLDKVYTNTSAICDLGFVARDGPKANFKENLTAVFLPLNMDLLVRNDSKNESIKDLAVGGEVDVNVNLTFGLKGGNLTADITGVTMENYKITSSKIGEVDTEGVTKAANAMVSLLLSTLNQMIHSAMANITLPTIGDIHLDNSKLLTHERYIEFGVDPYVKFSN